MSIPLVWNVGDRCAVRDGDSVSVGRLESVSHGFATVRFEAGRSAFVPVYELELVPFVKGEAPSTDVDLTQLPLFEEVSQ